MSLGTVYAYSLTAWKSIKENTHIKLTELGDNALYHKVSELGGSTAQKMSDFSKKIIPQDSFNKPDYAHIYQRKTRFQMIILSSAVCGIEFCYAAETAFVSPTLLKIGVHVMYMTLIWCLSPLLGFFLVPILGSCSDRCRLRIGRRRPFIFLLSIGIVIGLILVPNGRDIGLALGDTYGTQIDTSTISKNISKLYLNSYKAEHTLNHLKIGQGHMVQKLENTTAPKTWRVIGYHPWGIFFTVIGVVLLDFSSDACQSPCRAYLLDVTIPEDHAIGLSTFTVMAGAGGSLGYMMGGINWDETKVGEALGGHVRAVFTIVLIIYIFAVTCTLSSFKEIPLDELHISEEKLQKKKKRIGSNKYHKFTNEDDDDESMYGSIENPNAKVLQTNAIISQNSLTDSPYQSFEKSKSEPATPTVATENGKIMAAFSSTSTLAEAENLQQWIISHQDGITAPTTESPPQISLKVYLRSIVYMPYSLRILCLTNLFCWMSLVCYSLYFTDFVGQAVFGGDPRAPENSELHKKYEDGVRFGCWGMALYSASCAIYSYFIEKLVKRFRARPVYICGQLVYSFGMVIMGATRSQTCVVVFSATAGIMYATLFTMPYILVAHYHSSNTFELLMDGKKTSEIRGLGTDVAIVSSMVFLAQFILSACMGTVVHLAGTTVAVVVLAAILSFCGSLSATQVLYLDL